MQKVIDFNADVGEIPTDIKILKYVSSVNLGGAHVEDRNLVLRAIHEAAQLNLAIGAHPSLPDPANFGRVSWKLKTGQAQDIIFSQVGELVEIIEKLGVKLRHVKPHGALYNMAATDSVLAHEIANAIYEIDKKLIFVGLSGSAMADASKNVGLAFASEVFADRSYTSNGFLTPRSQPNAMLDHEQGIKQVLSILNNGFVNSTDGLKVNVKADTVCLHGDKPDACVFAAYIKQTLVDAGFIIKAVEKQKEETHITTY